MTDPLAKAIFASLDSAPKDMPALRLGVLAIIGFMALLPRITLRFTSSLSKSGKCPKKEQNIIKVLEEEHRLIGVYVIIYIKLCNNLHNFCEKRVIKLLPALLVLFIMLKNINKLQLL